jgi:hypothetical protein
MAVKTNVADGVSLEDTDAGLVGVQTVDVPGLSGSGLDMLYNALQHGSVPRKGATAQGVPGMQVVSRIARPNGVSGARVTVRYETPAADRSAATVGDVTVRVTTETITEETIYDQDGRIMKTKFAGFVTIGAVTAYEVSTQIHRVSVQRPTFSVQFTRNERAIAFAKALDFSSTVNSSPWQGRAALTWLMRIDSEQIEEDLHRVTYSAVYHPKTWLAEIRHTVSGRIPNTVQDNNGLERRPVYDEANFARIGLPRRL